LRLSVLVACAALLLASANAGALAQEVKHNSNDLMRYDQLTKELAPRALVRRVLEDTAKRGLRGDHHYYITFDTAAPGVQLAPDLRNRYPTEMTIILQYQFRGLRVSEQRFEVGLWFSGVYEKVVVPFDAIKAFHDPSVGFSLMMKDERTPETPPVSVPPGTDMRNHGT
jgi:hypothetical protein